MQSAIILLTASDEMRSRTMGTLVLAIGADPIGKLMSGMLASSLGASTAVAVQVSMALVALAVIAVMLPGMRAPSTAELQARPQVGGAD
jgi:hypothetical protein